ncbi:MAG: hypothetical protein PHR77_05175 [Kiritimatiellae bacterium]|nr:hypothetical protein [Kiritimatiellia bacterium]MDD5519733.1 hypothetical protein [Kiritimatiellia bacterium]
MTGNSRIHSIKGIAIKKVRDFLNSRPHAVWYTRYHGSREFVEYVNQEFAKAFGSTVDKVLKKKKYKTINPPGAPVQRYKKEDRIAMEKGIFLLRGGDPAITVVKVRFADGVLGMFIPAAGARQVSLDSLEPELIETLNWVKALK